ncbi:DUF2147 domain-containing protein [Limnohabitans sp. TS-CS-82]|jgi:uncharacterized protein (DUF2147 family)|uniref:DUF2147 domain-containing protein n=1 Tax=Limnohabitans sp. TS-CS-82 TaxID=2094193 RepID=UPI000CF2160F|nr:DUF2147 domain-containing protein [Limnohabitans sp. TS-CS-82]PQA85201.1 DUF2147 domain-containing protein [Limnohabitans sp. TS-CS-82]
MTHTHFFKTLVGLVLLAAGSSFAQMTPVGTWHSIDDKTGEAKAEIQIVDKDGALSGRVVKSLRNDPNAKKTCDDCKDDRKGQTIIGMEIVRGVKPDASGENLWASGGKILDPENGKEYTVKMVPQEGGKKLQVRGYIGPFYRTQVWLRAQ